MENGNAVEWLSSSQVARKLKRSVATVRNMAARGELKTTGSGRWRRYQMPATDQSTKVFVVDTEAEETVITYAWRLGRAGLSLVDTARAVAALSAK